MSRVQRQFRPQVVPLEVAQDLHEEAQRLEREAHQLKQAISELERENASLREELGARQEPESEPDDRLFRLAADLQNVRRHRDDQIEQARVVERVTGLARLAEVFDNLSLALHSLPSQEGPWYDGQRAILEQVRTQLSSAGATAFGFEGELFDPKIHEALGTGPGEPETVIFVQQVGFRLEDGTLVRPAKVIVGSS